MSYPELESGYLGMFSNVKVDQFKDLKGTISPKESLNPNRAELLDVALSARYGKSSSHLDLRNILSVRPPPILKKNKLLLNKYLGNFRHF